MLLLICNESQICMAWQYARSLPPGWHSICPFVAPLRGLHLWTRRLFLAYPGLARGRSSLKIAVEDVVNKHAASSRKQDVHAFQISGAHKPPRTSSGQGRCRWPLRADDRRRPRIVRQVSFFRVPPLLVLCPWVWIRHVNKEARIPPGTLSGRHNP